LYRTFLSALRKMEKRTTLRAEWTSDDSTREGSVDYVLKKTTNRIYGLAIDPITGPLPESEAGDPTDYGEPRAARMRRVLFQRRLLNLRRFALDVPHYLSGRGKVVASGT
jgi:hypothetical protein